MRYNPFPLVALLLILLPNASVRGQISHGGVPEMNSNDFDPARVIYLLPPEDARRVEGLKSASNNSFKKALNYATERYLDLSPEFNGEWVDKGDKSIWRVHVISPEAYSLGVVFSEYQLSDKAKLFIYSPDGKYIKGSFDHRNNKSSSTFFVNHLPGEELIVELQVQGVNRDYGSLRIASVSHAFLPVFATKGVGNTGLGTSQECEIDINCTEGDDWQIVKKSVVQINTPSLLCTGTLVNNTSYDGKPYILTAEHCISSEYSASNTVFTFGFENSDCGLLDATLDNSISGSELKATGGFLDFTLLELSERPPKAYDVYYAGWDAREQMHTGVYSLHHPNADAMKISYESAAVTTPNNVPGDLSDYTTESNYRVSEWDFGTTEGGSSGCPLFNSQKRVIGILSGGLALCGDSIGYDAEKDRTIFSLTNNRDDYFSKVYYSWETYEASNKQLKKWLDPINSGAESIGGLSGLTVAVSTATAAQNRVHTYPNPARDQITVELPYYTGNSLQTRIFDHSGRVVQLQSVSSVYPVVLTLPELTNGIYLLQLDDQNRRYQSRILISR